jgi:hypothetical protein
VHFSFSSFSLFSSLFSLNMALYELLGVEFPGVFVNCFLVEVLFGRVKYLTFLFISSSAGGFMFFFILCTLGWDVSLLLDRVASRLSEHCVR